MPGCKQSTAAAKAGLPRMQSLAYIPQSASHHLLMLGEGGEGRESPLVMMPSVSVLLRGVSHPSVKGCRAEQSTPTPILLNPTVTSTTTIKLSALYFGTSPSRWWWVVKQVCVRGHQSSLQRAGQHHNSIISALYALQETTHWTLRADITRPQKVCARVDCKGFA